MCGLPLSNGRKPIPCRREILRQGGQGAFLGFSSDDLKACAIDRGALGSSGAAGRIYMACNHTLCTFPRATHCNRASYALSSVFHLMMMMTTDDDDHRLTGWQQ